MTDENEPGSEEEKKLGIERTEPKLPDPDKPETESPPPIPPHHPKFPNDPKPPK